MNSYFYVHQQLHLLLVSVVVSPDMQRYQRGYSFIILSFDRQIDRQTADRPWSLVLVHCNATGCTAL